MRRELWAHTAPPSFFFLSFIKREIKIFISSTGMSSIALFRLFTKKPLPDVQVVFCFLTVFSARWAKM